MQFRQPGVEGVFLDELAVSSLGDEFSIIENENAIGIAHRCQAMGHHEGGAVGRELFQRFLNERLAFRIKGACRFIKQQDGGIAQNGAGDGDALALAAGEGNAAFAHFGVKSLGKLFGKLINARRDGGSHGSFARCLRRAEADVVENRAGKNDCILRHDGDVFAQFLGINRFDVEAIDRNGSGGGIVKALDEGKER